MRSNSSVIHAVFAAIGGLLLTAGVISVAPAAVLLGSAPAWADPGDDDCPLDPVLGTCIDVTLPGTDTPGTEPGSGGGGDNGSACRDKDGSEVPCSRNGMSWWGAPHWCYAAPDDPQLHPPAGKKADEGKWWSCQLDANGGMAIVGVWWVDNGEEPTPPVDPVAVANQLRVVLPYELANAQIAPPPTYHTYISYKNWMWVEGGQWRPVDASRTLQGATVTLTATPSYTSWDMGNGDTVSCAGPGRPWVKGMSEDAPTNCSYAYADLEDPEGDTWRVTARINYTLAWTCTGNCGGLGSGDLGEQLAAAGDTTTITVYQRQTVNKG